MTKKDNLNSLKEKVEKLQQKQSWVRKGLKEVLKEWAEVTKDINDKDLKLLFLTTIEETTFFLKTGDAKVFNEFEGVMKKHFRNSGKYEYVYHDIYHEYDFVVIRKILNSLKKNLERFEKRLDDKNKECEKFKQLLNKFQQGDNDDS